MEVGEILEYRLKKELSMKVLNAVGNSQRSYPRTKLGRLMSESRRSNQNKRIDLRENAKRKNHREEERRFYYNSMRIIMVIISSARVFGFSDRPHCR